MTKDSLILGLADRVAAQAELLARRAERKPVLYTLPKVEVIHAICENCRFSKRAYQAGNGRIECRRYAPGPSGFPVMGENEWCGDYVEDRAKFQEVQAERRRQSAELEEHFLNQSRELSKPTKRE
jgi:hypothetical protein